MDKHIQQPISVDEWYDFIGLMAGGLQFIHTGGNQATNFLVQGCRIDNTFRVLDVGCGGGYTACRLANEIGCQVIGIDISEVMLEQASKRAENDGVTDKVTFHHADVADLFFDEEFFNAALVESVLTPLPGNKLDALKEICRVLMPGGYLGLNEAVFKEEMKEDVKEILNSHPAINNPFSDKTLREAVIKTGFKVLKRQNVEQADLPNPIKQLGFKGLMTFMLNAYPKILVSMLTDRRIREAARVANQITQVNNQYMSSKLVIAQKNE